MGCGRNAKRTVSRTKMAPPTTTKTVSQKPYDATDHSPRMGHWAVLRRLHRHAPPPPPLPSSTSPRSGKKDDTFMSVRQRCRPWRRSERWFALTDNELAAAAVAAFGIPPWRHRTGMALLRRALGMVMGPVADLSALWPTFYSAIGGKSTKRRCWIPCRVGEVVDTKNDPKMNATEETTPTTTEPGMSRMVRGSIHADAVAALHALSMGGSDSHWRCEYPDRCATDRDPDACRMWSLRRSNGVAGRSMIYLSITITTDDRGHPWNGTWPLPHGATAGVFVRVYPRAFLVDRPQDIDRLLEYATGRLDERHIIHQYSLFFDDGDDIVVFRDVGGFEKN